MNQHMGQLKRLRSEALLQRLTNEAWKNPEKSTYFCEQKKWTLQCQCPTEPTQWQEIKGTKFLTATRASNNAASAILLSFQNLTTSILCSKTRLTGDPAGPIILFWVWVVTMLPPPSLEKFDAKHAKDGNATWNKNTFLTNYHRPQIYNLHLSIGSLADRGGRIHQVSLP